MVDDKPAITKKHLKRKCDYGWIRDIGRWAI